MVLPTPFLHLPDNLRRAAALLVLSTSLLIFPFGHIRAAECGAEKIDEQVTVRHVYDGDTVVLEDGRKLRLLGFNTPEVARKQRPAEPLAVQAQIQLSDWIKGSRNRIGLQYDQELTDHYKRSLAHVFLEDGRNVAALTLASGLAAGLPIPPNLNYVDCYTEAEARARTEKLGIWALAEYQPVELANLKSYRNRYIVLQGHVLESEQNDRGMTLWIGDRDFAEKVRVSIHKEDLGLFSRTQLKVLNNRHLIEVRGWLHQQDKNWTLRLQHPANLRIPPLQG